MGVLLLRNVCDEPALRIEVLVPGDQGRAVTGTALVDIPHPSRWLEAGRIAVTTGVLLRDHQDASVFVAEVAGEQAPAVVFLRGAVQDDLPPGLVEACRDADLALLAVPPAVSHLDLEHLVGAAVHDAEAYRLRRRLWFQTDLLAALADERPLHALVTRMAHLVRGAAVLYDASGRIVASVGEAPTRLLWSELAGRPRAGFAASLGRYRVLAVPVVIRGSGYWLAVVSRQEQTIRDVGGPLLETAAQMLSAMRGAQNLTRAQDLARARSLVAQLTSDVGPERVRYLWAQLRLHGFPHHGGVRVVIARSIRERPARERLDHLEGLYEEAHLAALPVVLAEDVHAGDAALTAIVADTAGLSRWLDHVARGHAVGVSEPTGDLTVVGARSRDALTAVDLLGTREEVSWFEEVSLAAWLSAGRPPAAVRARSERLLGDVAHDTELRRTLVTHLRGGSDVAVTARELFLHPNTVRYRIRKVERLLGGSLRDPLVFTNVCLALYRDLVLGPDEAGKRL